jgi:hypothetical protein
VFGRISVIFVPIVKKIVGEAVSGNLVGGIDGSLIVCFGIVNTRGSSPRKVYLGQESISGAFGDTSFVGGGIINVVREVGGSLKVSNNLGVDLMYIVAGYGDTSLRGEDEGYFSKELDEVKVIMCAKEACFINQPFGKGRGNSGSVVKYVNERIGIGNTYIEISPKEVDIGVTGTISKVGKSSAAIAKDSFTGDSGVGSSINEVGNGSADFGFGDIDTVSRHDGVCIGLREVGSCQEGRLEGKIGARGEDSEGKDGVYEYLFHDYIC